MASESRSFPAATAASHAASDHSSDNAHRPAPVPLTAFRRLHDPDAEAAPTPHDGVAVSRAAPDRLSESVRRSAGNPPTGLHRLRDSGVEVAPIHDGVSCPTPEIPRRAESLAVLDHSRGAHAQQEPHHTAHPELHTRVSYPSTSARRPAPQYKRTGSAISVGSRLCPVPGIWFVKVGASRAQVKDIQFEVDEATASAASTPNA
jgi:hypothetical protein